MESGLCHIHPGIKCKIFAICEWLGLHENWGFAVCSLKHYSLYMRNMMQNILIIDLRCLFMFYHIHNITLQSTRTTIINLEIYLGAEFCKIMFKNTVILSRHWRTHSFPRERSLCLFPFHYACNMNLFYKLVTETIRLVCKFLWSLGRLWGLIVISDNSAVYKIPQFVL